MYATAPRTQLRPEPGDSGEYGLGNFATLRRINLVQQNTTTAPQHEHETTHSIRMYAALKSRKVWRGTCARFENDDGLQVEMYARF